MPLARVYERLVVRTRPAPRLAHVAGVVAVTAACWGIRYAVTAFLPAGIPFLLSFLGVLLCALLFDLWAGLASVALSMAAAAYFVLPPLFSFRVEQVQHMVALGLFATVGGITALVVETLHRAIAKLAEAERRRTLLLTEYRHRGRNDLMAIVADLLLRGRFVADPAAKQAFKDAAERTRHLALIHSRLSHASHDRNEVATVDAGEFVLGLCQDLSPPGLESAATGGPLSTERGVTLGLLLTELVSDARRDGAGRIAVRLGRCGPDYVLRVLDDRPCAPTCEGDSLRSRMVRAMAKQLRGDFTTATTTGGACCARVRFPVEAPSLAPARVGV